MNILFLRHLLFYFQNKEPVYVFWIFPIRLPFLELIYIPCILHLYIAINSYYNYILKCEQNQTYSWEQRKLYEVADFNPKSELPETFEYVDLESVVGTEMISHRTETRDTAPSRAQRLAQTGDVFFQTVRPYQRNNYLFAKPDNNYVFSTGYAQMRPKIEAEFLMCFLQTDSFVKVVLDNCTGTSYPAINSNDLSNLEISLPSSADEQRRIGSFITNLDNLITLQQREQSG